jgi:pSer/pThr/pTyr-binding forkhead associated (FHA) protein
MSLSNKITLSLISGAFFAFLAWILVDFTPIYDHTAGRIASGSGWQLVLVQLPITGLFGILVGLGIGAVNGLSSGSAAQFRRDAFWGAACGLIGGVVGIIYGQAIFGVLYIQPTAETAGNPFVFLESVIARALGWAFIGVFIGLSQGLPSRSPSAARHGAVGGFIGGLIGGALFQILPWIPPFGDSGGRLARGVSFVVTGAFIGFFIGLVQSLMRQAWVRVVAGRNEGREYIISKPRTTIGRDELSDIGLFGDHTIAFAHAVIDAVPRGRHVLRDAGSSAGTSVNGVKITDRTLRDGETIEIGSMKLEFHEKATMSRVPKKSDFVTRNPIQIPASPDRCPFCGGKKNPLTGACACSVPDQQPEPEGLPQEPQAQVQVAVPPAFSDGVPRLVGVSGPYAGQEFHLDYATTSVGRDSGTMIDLPMDGTVSRHHARVVNENGQFIVYDDGSSNGTAVNGARVSAQNLVPGDTVSFGTSAFRFEA